MLIHVAILIWVLTPSNLVNVVFTSNHIVHLLEIMVLRELRNNGGTYLGHNDDLVAG